jgi:hypothetical protein
MTLRRITGVALLSFSLSVPVLADTVCKFLTLTSANNAAEIATKLADFKDATIRATSPGTLFVCGPQTIVTEMTKAANQLAANKPQTPPQSEQHSVHLYYSRNASDIATAIDQVYPSVKVKAFGIDTLIFQTSDLAQEQNIHEIKRWIAILDAPKPEVSLNVWSVQLSSHELNGLIEPSNRVRLTVARFNQELQTSLERGWNYLNTLLPAAFSPVFKAYVIDNYRKGAPDYALGFGNGLNPLQPKLTHMLAFLSASNTPLSTATAFVNALEGPAVDATIGGDCELRDQRSPLSDLPLSDLPLFNCLREQLGTSLQPAHNALLRRAIADFLFQYKYSTESPHEFSPFDYSLSAQALDSQFDPLLVAFNRDVAAYLSRLQTNFLKEFKKSSKLVFSSGGVVSIRTIASIESEADTTTENSFLNTPPPLVQDFMKQLATAESSGGTSALLKTNLAGHAATALTAFLNSGKASTVSLGRSLNLKITPFSLPGAGAAELKLHMEVKDESAPQTLNADSSAKTDTTDRVSSQLLDTSVRVESLKLFDVSSFEAALSRGRQPIPLVPPFVDLPYIGSFVKLKRDPSVVYHKSFAIVSAVVVPTAADMLSGLRYQKDTDAPKDLRVRHATMLQHIVCEAQSINPMPPDRLANRLRRRESWDCPEGSSQVSSREREPGKLFLESTNGCQHSEHDSDQAGCIEAIGLADK